MTTSNIREKMNVLGNLLLQADLEQFQLQLTIDCAATPSGDAQADAQLQMQSKNAATQLAIVRRRIEVCQAQLDHLTIEAGG